MEKQNLIFSENIWAGVSNWFYRGGKVSGPTEVLGAFTKIVENDIEQSALSLIKGIIPFTILFDNIYVVSEIPLSDPFINDLKKCLGVKFLRYRQIDDVIPSRDEVESYLYKIFSSSEDLAIIQKLYHLAGPFAGDLPDLIPAMRNILTSMKLSKKLNASLNCSAKELDVHKFVGERFISRETNQKVDIMQETLRLHKMPILTVDAFRNKDKSINLDVLFSSLETVRKSKYIYQFRKKIEFFFKNKSQEIADSILEDLIQDLREMIENLSLEPMEIGKRMSSAVLMDVLGYFIPGTGTLKELLDLKKEKSRSAGVEWRLFVFEYGDQIKKYKIA